MTLPLAVGGGLAAHGVGGATDLPVPFMYAMVGASWALTISFAVLALAWKTPRFTAEPPSDRPPARRSWLAVLGLLVTAWVLIVLFAGPDDASNGGMQAFYIFVWVGIVPLALVAGHVWRDLSPWRTLTGAGRWMYPERLGYWPAATGLFAFAWLELASPDPGDIGAVRVWVVLYLAAMLLGGWAFGPRWFDRADPFDVYSAIVARLSPCVRDGRWTLHNPLRTLPQLPVARGLIAVLAVLLGSTAYDSFSASEFWQSRSVSVGLGTATLLGFCVVVCALFVAATSATGGLTPEQRKALPGSLAHSLVPIVVGYVFAHYLTYLLEKGQGAFLALCGREPEISYFLTEHTSTLAALKVTFVVAGHVLAVIAAHDKALALLPKAHRLSGQLTMLILMVAYTFTGLYLLFSV